ncbi:hypothetical protein HanPI659440_Chr17g0680131 [Helianthus annuus]|nr:hypothetical protein HanPI659440_Chr17g0680131 [Helianthus annuus]
MVPGFSVTAAAINQLHSNKQPQFQAVRVSVRLDRVRGFPVTVAVINQPHIGDQPQFQATRVLVRLPCQETSTEQMVTAMRLFLGYPHFISAIRIIYCTFMYVSFFNCSRIVRCVFGVLMVWFCGRVEICFGDFGESI